MQEPDDGSFPAPEGIVVSIDNPAMQNSQGMYRHHEVHNRWQLRFPSRPYIIGSRALDKVHKSGPKVVQRRRQMVCIRSRYLCCAAWWWTQVPRFRLQIQVIEDWS